MIMDATNLFSDNQAITADAASTNVIDLGANRDIGPGTPVPLLVQVTEDFNTLTSLTVQVQTDDAEGFGTAETLVQSTAALAKLKAGFKFPVAVVPNQCKRYLRLNYDVTGTNPTEGKITAGIVTGLQTNV